MMAIPALLLAATVAQVAPTGEYAGSPKEAELAMAAFAACEVRSASGKRAALAYTREAEDTPSNYPARLANSPCARTGTTLRFNGQLFRMVLFPALYARDYRTASPLIDATKVPPTDYAREFDGPQSAHTMAVRAFGDCVVRKDPATSREFVLSKPYSRIETAVIERLRPSLAACLPTGEVRFSRSVAHGAIGEALYKLTAASAATKAS